MFDKRKVEINRYSIFN